MRAICESCARPQPADWRPGDLCVHCGHAAREEARCFWCAKWGPRGKFCRKCGAASVAPEHYGPARMLKQMGASVFEIPKLLGELDADLIETHRSIYGTHAALVNRHVEDARWLSGFLYQKHWADELENELIPRLPLPEEAFNAYSRPARALAGDIKTAREIAADSPFPLVQDIARLVQISLGDFSAVRDVANLLHSPNAEIAAEAALQLSGWRALYATYTEIKRYDLIAVLDRSPLPEHAAPRLAVLGKEPRPEYSPTGDADTDFLILILEQNIRALQTQLDSSDPMRAYVAATHLIRLQAADSIGPVLRRAEEEYQLQMLRDIVRYKRPIPALHGDLFALVEESLDGRVVRSAAEAICLAGGHAESMRLLSIASGNSDIIHALLRSKPAPATYYEIGSVLVHEGKFNTDQWGWDEAAKPGRMPISFVEDLYPHASYEVQGELLKFAEKQIEAHGLERSSLERHLIRQCFAESPPELTGEAWACIHRVQMYREVGRTAPCDLTLENVEWCWTVPEILVAIAGLMSNPTAVRQTFVRDDFDGFLRSAAPDFYKAAAKFPYECRQVISAAPKADPYTYSVRFAEELATFLQ